MSKVYSYSFLRGDIRGDMFFISHDNDSFTVIDCNLADGREQEILDRIYNDSKDKSYKRFISTHPDKDHIFGLEKLIDKIRIPASNFYAVRNDVPAEKDDASLTKYLRLMKDTKSAAIRTGLKRDFLNQDEAGKGVGPSGIEFYWPDLNNPEFKKALDALKNGGKANNICPIILYSAVNGAKFLWMGDLETSMQEEFFKQHKGIIGRVNVLFAPHHGRESGQVPAGFLKELNPDIVVVGNAPSENLETSYGYYGNERTITQNSAKDILFDCHDDVIDVYTGTDCDNLPKILKKNYFIKDVQYRGSISI